MACNLIVILGPTASGKTRLAARLARALGSEIISADSRQVYRGMDIGTGKDREAFLVDGVSVPVHLIDIRDPWEAFSVFDYQRSFFKIFSALRGKGVVPIMAGGTGLYLDAVIRRYRMPEAPVDPELRSTLGGMDREGLVRRLQSLRPSLHNTTDLTDRERLVRAIEIAERGSDPGSPADALPETDPFIIGIRWNREILRERITRRLVERLDEGMVDEVRRLNAAGLTFERMEAFGLEYRYVARYLRGMMAHEEMVRELTTRIHQYAKRQMTWFRRMERQGLMIHWVEGDCWEPALEMAGSALGREDAALRPGRTVRPEANGP